MQTNPPPIVRPLRPSVKILAKVFLTWPACATLLGLWENVVVLPESWPAGKWVAGVYLLAILGFLWAPRRVARFCLRVVLFPLIIPIGYLWVHLHIGYLEQLGWLYGPPAFPKKIDVNTLFIINVILLFLGIPSFAFALTGKTPPYLFLVHGTWEKWRSADKSK